MPFNIAVQEPSEEHLAGCCQVTAVQILERTFKVENVNVANNVAGWKAPVGPERPECQPVSLRNTEGLWNTLRLSSMQPTCLR